MLRPIWSSWQPVAGDDYCSDEDLFSISELYHENTKLHDPGEGVRPDLLAPNAIAAMANAKMVFREVPQIALDAFDIPDSGTVETLRRRRSVRSFDRSRVTLKEIAVLLEGANGITESRPISEGVSLNLRASPSAGALYPAEVFVGVQQVTGLECGLYHHNPSDQRLAALRSGDFRTELKRICLGIPYIDDAAAVLFLTANLKRVRLKYGERGYRYALLDLGHLMQSLWLVATELRLGFVSLGGFDDNAGVDFLPIDGVDVILGYIAVVGTPKEIV